MDILAFKPGHDGAAALISNETLVFSLEGEKDSFPRYSELHTKLFLDILTRMDKIPEVIAMSGWSKRFHDNIFQPFEAGYLSSDLEKNSLRKIKILGKEVDFFSSSHLRSHILSAYSMSPLEQGERCYVLVWEGVIGSFYEIDEKMNIIHIKEILYGPGSKYGFIYSIADPRIKSSIDTTAPGKVMALASFSNRDPYTQEEKEMAEFLIAHQGTKIIDKNDFKKYSLYNIGVESLEFKNFAGKFSDTIFNLFYSFAKQNLNKRLPLIISGGCGLNCDWNTKWKNSGLFKEVFVPPVPNDSGSAIGTAIDAQLYYTGRLKIEWNIYAGEEFINDEISLEKLELYDLNYNQVANFLTHNKIIGWVQGRYEIGPRALENRSILASPLAQDMQSRLNKIKKRENFRPIAPICIEEDVSKYFDWSGSSPYMLYFQKLKTNMLPAITHVDGTARVQTVNHSQNNQIYNLLSQFKNITGFGVLCNTSLNFNGMGFINRRSDLLEYSKNQGLDGFVIHDKFYRLKK
jgi:predicted NodU family carbamoyl transferase